MVNSDMAQQSFKVIVKAEDQDEKLYEVEIHAAANKALQEVREKWALHYKVDKNEVSLEDQEERPIDLDRTPTELGWSNYKEPIKLWAIPVGDLAAEEDQPELEKRDARRREPEKREASAHDGVQDSTTEPEAEEIPESIDGSEKRKHSGEASEEKPAKKQAVSIPETHASLQADTDAAAAAARAAEKTPPPKAEAAGAPRQSPVERAPGPAAPEPMKAEPPKAERHWQAPAPVKQDPKVQRAPPSNPTAAKAASKPAGRPAAGKTAGRAPAERRDPEERPADDEQIVFAQENQKMKGSKAHERYEKYKRATTPRQALQLGAGKGDLDNDWKKGFYRRA